MARRTPDQQSEPAHDAVEQTANIELQTTNRLRELAKKIMNNQPEKLPQSYA